MVETPMLQLNSQLLAAGLPVVSVFGPPWRADLAAGATQAQIDLAASICAAFDGRPRVPRPGYAIYADLQALTAGQKTNIWLNLSTGNPAKYLTDTGPGIFGIGALDWAVTNSGATGAALAAARLRIAAAYVYDNPSYLVNPSWDTSINVPGDAPA